MSLSAESDGLDTADVVSAAVGGEFLVLYEDVIETEKDS